MTDRKDAEWVEYLKLIQNVIARLAGNAVSVKLWSVTLTTGTVAFLAKETTVHRWVGLMAIVMFFWLDGFYLDQERRYRTLYGLALKRKVELFDMRAPVPDQQRHRFNAWASSVVWPFYAVLGLTYSFLAYPGP